MQLRLRSGFSFGVAGVVLDGERVLLVRRMHEPNRGRWTFPSGWVKSDEGLHEAVAREIKEETGVEAEVIGVVGLRQRISPNDNNLVVNFLLRPLAGEPAPDNVEVDGAAYFELQAALANPDLIALNKAIVRKLIVDRQACLEAAPCPPTPGLPGRYFAFL
ncbi:MAG: NUDIX domain-containing protein [Chloroflexi bacterium]|nr:NUDIX domain-containing protein [Chloroflexota bacterium]MCL5109503.1 NUDIX domain-containing protein [Chloroflexota bacterium]